MKVIKWILKSIIISLLLLFVTNVLGTYINVNIPINIWTILIVGVFRIPGIIILIIFFLL
ncbi:MAG: pro-sigmaK processing inhibitor BofA family protein [Bacilli bacterium]|nr:pro-sigmaK processing inhibitor BofA family protein [Acholeplasmataceae bacterium]MDY2902168.1 pro-sigmaK processing inhibitor BofA family protein [Bacilli bacterium]